MPLEFRRLRGIQRIVHLEPDQIARPSPPRRSPQFMLARGQQHALALQAPRIVNLESAGHDAANGVAPQDTRPRKHRPIQQRLVQNSTRKADPGCRQD